MELIVEQLSCVRGGRRVFSDAAFTLAGGEFAALVGPNGSGKSSLLRAVAGLTPIERGDARFGETSLREDRDGFQEQVAYVGHLDGVKPSFTVRENLRAWARISGEPAGPDLERRIDGALERFQLEALDDAPAAICSAGQKRRAGLARLALIARPLWLLDEPTVALDAASNAALGALIDAHRRAGGVILAATHTAFGAAPDREIAMQAFSPAADKADDPFLDDAGDPESWA